MKKNLAIIPARSGSKGVSHKNIKLLSGKPLMAYTIEAAVASNVFSKIIVSTDSAHYAETAVDYGADVPFLRSAETSSDGASSLSVLQEVMQNLEEHFDTVTLLQPTSPFRTARNICEGMEIFLKNAADSVISVCELEKPLFLCNTLPHTLSLNGFIKKEYIGLRRQDMPTHYSVNGALYILREEIVRSGDNWYGEKSYAYKMPKDESLDIDDDFDFKLAEALLYIRRHDEAKT